MYQSRGFICNFSGFKNPFKPASNFIVLIVPGNTSVVVLIVLCLGVYFFFLLLAPYVCYQIFS